MSVESHFLSRCLIRLPSLLGALSVSTAVRAADAEVGVPGSAFFQAFIGLALIVALLLLAAFLGRKLWAGKGFGQSGLHMIGGIALSPRERIVLIEAGETWLVVGIVPGQIRTLHTMPKGETPPVQPGLPPPFSQWLRQAKTKLQPEVSP